MRAQCTADPIERMKHKINVPNGTKRNHAKMVCVFHFFRLSFDDEQRKVRDGVTAPVRHDGQIPCRNPHLFLWIVVIGYYGERTPSDFIQYV